ncbi:hypothetical protein KIPB_001163 [Kipferlia bialata]|uniref:Rubredoxin-like domain-containing protein n=1 Tax=Kipferlia bialata TaxID=797122 RepID=A0A9K3CPP6_9EUKA|nr:hypothetical protein KIPB_001163 [Kipferlia bialata]|eukprot:g1163.t1
MGRSTMYHLQCIQTVEAEHERRYKAFLSNIEDGSVFEKKEEVYWQCRNCGHVHHGKKAPGKCPTCDHPQAYFEVRAANY